MNKISISQAWAYATSFFDGQHPAHAIILIGMGVAGPLVLNLLLGGAVATVPTDAASLASGAGAMAALTGTAMLIGILAFVIQTGSYFASWRIGLDPGDDSIGSAIGYGLVAALPVLLVSFAIILMLGIILGVLFGASILPLILSGGSPTGAQAAGAGLTVLAVVPAMLLFFLWLTARFCCMGPAMADQRTYNPFTGLAESWRMTAASQWKLMAYFALLAVVLMIVMLIVGMVAGVSMLAGGQPGTVGTGIALVAGIVVGVPMAYLYTAVPAGIYRALGGGDVSDVFA